MHRTGAEVVDVWIAPLVVPDVVATRLLASLTKAERARADRFRHAADARRFAMARGWLRHVLSAELGVAPEKVAIGEGRGKPRLALPGPCFNLSHAGGLALVAVATAEVGVDVEHVQSGTAGLEAAEAVCSPGEIGLLDRLPTPERAPTFLRMWTAKEAYLKGRGVGLAWAPDQVEVGVGTGDEPLPVHGPGEEGPARWWVRTLRPDPHHVGAVAAEGADWTVRLRAALALDVAQARPPHPSPSPG